MKHFGPPERRQMKRVTVSFCYRNREIILLTYRKNMFYYSFYSLAPDPVVDPRLNPTYGQPWLSQNVESSYGIFAI